MASEALEIYSLLAEPNGGKRQDPTWELRSNFPAYKSIAEVTWTAEIVNSCSFG